jgi:tRNA(Ile)-lysidine synthetase-like protein
MPGDMQIDHRHPLIKTVAAALRDRCAAPAGARLLVAVSGGADSVALLRALALLAPRGECGLSLAVGHVHHHLRDEADDDARFVERLAGELKLPFLRGDLDLNHRRGNLESAARRRRYAALVEMARTIGAPFIVTAHHGDDQLETLLMRLLRGASVRGLRGMAWRRVLRFDDDAGRDGDSDSARPLAWGCELLRPLLAVGRDEIIRFLRDLGQAWREDHTNADATRLRARLRRDVLPVLHDLKPDIIHRAAGLADHLRQVSALLDDAVSAAADRVVVEGGDRVIDRTDARTLRRVVLGGLLRRLLVAAGAKADRLGGRALAPVLRAIRDATGGTRTFNLSRATVVLTRDSVTIRKS